MNRLNCKRSATIVSQTRAVVLFGTTCGAEADPLAVIHGCSAATHHSTPNGQHHRFDLVRQTGTEPHRVCIFGAPLVPLQVVCHPTHNQDEVPSARQKENKMYSSPTASIELERSPEAPTQETQSSQVVPLKRTKDSPSVPPAPIAKRKRPRKVNVRTIRRMKEQAERITMLTAYDALFAQILDRAGIDMLLVGDSLGMVVQGEQNTLAVTLEQMIYHTRCVARTTQRAMVVGDMPFMSYQTSPEQALENAGRLVKEGGAHAVKLEGGRDVADAVRKITRAGIPVVGHLGLTPQSVHAMGGFVVQGRDPERAQEILEDALLLQEAGAFCLVLEGIPAALSQRITEALSIPTIGIGAGIHCDGQVLVTQDMLGLNPDFAPSFVKRFANLYDHIDEAIQGYVSEVKEASFPNDDYSFSNHTETRL